MHAFEVEMAPRTQPNTTPFAMTGADRTRAGWFGRPEEEPTEALSPLDQAAQMIDDAHCPLLCLGSEIGIAKAGAAVLDFAERAGLPMAVTAKTSPLVATAHPLLVGPLDAPMSRFMKMILQETDLMIVVGARTDDQAIQRAGTHCPTAGKIRIGSRAAAAPADVCLSGGIEPTIEALLERLHLRRRGKWLVRVEGLRQALLPLRRIA